MPCRMDETDAKSRGPQAPHPPDADVPPETSLAAADAGANDVYEIVPCTDVSGFRYYTLPKRNLGPLEDGAFTFSAWDGGWKWSWSQLGMELEHYEGPIRSIMGSRGGTAWLSAGNYPGWSPWRTVSDKPDLNRYEPGTFLRYFYAWAIPPAAGVTYKWLRDFYDWRYPELAGKAAQVAGATLTDYSRWCGFLTSDGVLAPCEFVTNFRTLPNEGDVRLPR
jgi:hypothetical protein